MYIEFQLPTGSAASAAGYAFLLIRKDLIEWNLKYNIPYKEKLVKSVVKVTLPSTEDYSFFGLTWAPTSYAASKYRLVDPMARPPK